MHSTKKSIYQTGSISSLVSGVYDGDTTVADIRQLGNFGLGTPDRVRGEMFVENGQVYCADEHGNVRQMAPEELTPFTVVTDFSADDQFELAAVNSFTELEQQLDQHLPSLNYIYALRITGRFDTITARSECEQPRPYRPLHETLPTLQRVFEWQNIEGTMVTLRFPHHLNAVNVAGYHLHFIDQTCQKGGHVFGLSASTPLTVQVCKVDRLVMDTIDNACFAQTPIAPVSDDNIQQVEKIRS